MIIKHILPDNKNTFAIFEVSETDHIELPVICWAVIETDNPDLPIDTVGMVIQEGDPALITVDAHELLFTGYVTHKAG